MKRDKVALVLAGGGITGAVYQVGALRAIEDMLVDYTVQDFDIYVGTSAGALVSSLIVNGLSPAEIMQILDRRHPEIQSMSVGDLFQTNIGGMVRRAIHLPKTLYDVGWNSLRHLRDVAISDILWEFAHILPTGLYNGQGLEKYVRTVLEERGGANRFDQLEKTLFIIATELETGKRAVFGQGGKSIVLISQAVAASSAIPILYQPVEIFHRDYIDGGLHGSASIDLAIEAGAKLVVCINPMVPLDTTGIPGKQHYVRERGFQAITNQSIRTLLHSGVRYHIKSLRVKYPDVDIIVVEPQPDDYRMFSYNPMYFGSRLTVAEHGFESVTMGLLDNFEHFQQILMRHDIQLTKELVAEELMQIRSSGEDPEVVQQIIERSIYSFPGSDERVDMEERTM